MTLGLGRLANVISLPGHAHILGRDRVTRGLCVGPGPHLDTLLVTAHLAPAAVGVILTLAAAPGQVATPQEILVLE